MSEAREVRSFIGWNLFQLVSIWVPGHSSELGNVTNVFYHKDGMLLHISILWRFMSSTNFSLVPGHSVVLGNYTLFILPHNDGWLLHIKILSCEGYEIF